MNPLLLSSQIHCNLINLFFVTNSNKLLYCRSLSRSKSRSRSHSFSPPSPGENGKSVEEEQTVNDEEERIREEAINALPPYYPALQVKYIYYCILKKIV